VGGAKEFQSITLTPSEEREADSSKRKEREARARPYGRKNLFRQREE